MKVFNNGKTRQYFGVAYSLKIILDMYPEDSQYMKIKSIPTELIQSKEPAQRSLVYPALPTI